MKEHAGYNERTQAVATLQKMNDHLVSSRNYNALAVKHISANHPLRMIKFMKVLVWFFGALTFLGILGIFAAGIADFTNIVNENTILSLVGIPVITMFVSAFACLALVLNLEEEGSFWTRKYPQCGRVSGSQLISKKPLEFCFVNENLASEEIAKLGIPSHLVSQTIDIFNLNQEIIQGKRDVKDRRFIHQRFRVALDMLGQYSALGLGDKQELEELLVQIHGFCSDITPALDSNLGQCDQLQFLSQTR